jgi:C4-dicarboxylate-specific signal transduction histidine kinase
MLFKPFKELQVKQDFEKVKHKTIGLGLACSRDIAVKLGGSLDILFSANKLTSFAFRIPV